MAMLFEDWPWAWDCSNRGRQLVEAGDTSPVSQVDWFDVSMFRMQQQQMATELGGCEACCEGELVRLPNGAVVCRRTYQPCKRLEVSSLVDFYKKAFE